MAEAGRLSRISERARKLGYRLKHDEKLIAARETIVSTTGETALRLGLPVLGNAGGISGLAMGTAVAGLSAYLAIRDHDKHLGEVKKLYSEEIAAQLGKNTKDLTSKDLDILANGDKQRGIEPNRTISDQLKKARRRRNFDIVFSVIATVAAFSLVHAGLLESGLLKSVIDSMGIAAGSFLEGAVGVVIKGAASFLTFMGVKKPLHAIADKMYNVDRETTHDRIIALSHCMKKGMNVGRDHVLSVFISANPDLDRFIENRFGGDFETLDIAQRAKATDLMAQYLPIDQLTKDINDRKINVGELAFAVQGEKSGVLHSDLYVAPEPKKGLAKAWDKLTSAFQEVREAPEVRNVRKHYEEIALVKAIEEPQDGVAPEAKWVERVGGKRAAREMAHVQRLDEQAAAASMQTGGVPG